MEQTFSCDAQPEEFERDLSKAAALADRLLCGVDAD